MSFQGIRAVFNRGRKAGILALVGSLALASAAIAASHVGFTGKPGTHRPPAKLHHYAMTKFGPDNRADYSNVTSVKGPTGKVFFSHTVSKRTIGNGWIAWSNGYSGAVYFNQKKSVTLTLPAGTKAFYFYAEPNQFGKYRITATANGASSGGVLVGSSPTVGGGARYFGFYAKDSTSRVTRVNVKIAGETGGGQGFAIGEFGIH